MGLLLLTEQYCIQMKPTPLLKKSNIEKYIKYQCFEFIFWKNFIENDIIFNVGIANNLFLICSYYLSYAPASFF